MQVIHCEQQRTAGAQVDRHPLQRVDERALLQPGERVLGGLVAEQHRCNEPGATREDVVALGRVRCTQERLEQGDGDAEGELLLQAGAPGGQHLHARPPGQRNRRAKEPRLAETGLRTHEDEPALTLDRGRDGLRETPDLGVAFEQRTSDDGTLFRAVAVLGALRD